MQPEISQEKLRRKVRVCSTQYLMKPISSWGEIEEQVSHFCLLAEKNQSQFLLLPEYFCIQLFSSMPEGWTDKKKIIVLAKKYEQYQQMFINLSKNHNLYIIAGSHPVLKDDGYIYNVAHLFTPSGNVYTQPKLHITPKERQTWNYNPGDDLKLFDTPYGRIGIQICYDIEFPEITRLMALSGVDIIFIPFYTQDRSGYQRVLYSAQARAVENYLYSVISGSTANLLTPTNLICFSQSAILTPSDIGFPENAILAMADPNIQTSIIIDLDLDLLHEMRQNGTVKPLEDRREDLYSLISKVPIEIIEVN
jgi:predicted amidohydrolase